MKAMLLGAAAALVIAGPAAAETIEIKVGIFLPPQTPYVQKGYVPWIKNVNKEAGGTIKLVWYKGTSLGNARTIYRNIVSGVADAGMAFPTNTPGKFEAYSSVAHPFLADSKNDHSEASSMALWRTYERGVLDQEFDQVKPLMVVNLPPINMYSRVEIKTVDDFKGKKMRSSTFSPFAEAMGAVPVNISVPQMYQALQRGTVEVNGSIWPGYVVFKLKEVTDYIIEGRFGTGSSFVIMNAKKLASLPKKGRDALLKYSGYPLSRTMGRLYDNMARFAKGRAIKDGKKIIRLSAADEAKMKKMFEPVRARELAKIKNGATVAKVYAEELKKAKAELAMDMKNRKSMKK